MNKKFQQLKNVLENLTGNLRPNEYTPSGAGPKNNDAIDFIDFIKKWNQIVDLKIAAVSMPLNIKKGNLTILTNHPTTSETILFNKHRYQEKIHSLFPKFKITNFHFICQPNFFKENKNDIFQAKSKEVKVEKINPKEWHPLDPNYKRVKKEADIMFNDISDLDLKDSLTSLFLQLHL